MTILVHHTPALLWLSFLLLSSSRPAVSAFSPAQQYHPRRSTATPITRRMPDPNEPAQTATVVRSGASHGTSRHSASRSSSSSSTTHRSMLPQPLLTALLDTHSSISNSIHLGKSFTPSWTTTTTAGALPTLFTSAPAFGLTSVSAVALLDTSTNVATSFGGDPSVEVQVLTDMSHLGLDLAGYLIPSGMIVLRLAAVVGRLCSVAADYVPDHTIVPEELLFQVCMLSAAWMGLFKAALLPAFSVTATKPVTVKDGRAYTALFAPAGTTWADFKALSVCTLDWITVDAGQAITTDVRMSSRSEDENDEDEDDYIYWLYSGTVQVESEFGEILYSVSRRAGAASKQDAGLGLLGERRLLRRLERKSSSKQQPGSNNNKSTSSQSRSTVRATHPSTLLRIHTPSLQLLAESDGRLADSIRTLVFQGLEAKLHHAQLTSRRAFNGTAMA